MNLYVIQEIRTNNFNDPEILSKIQKLWGDSMQEIQQLKYRGVIYGVYHTYDSNYKGDYTLSVMIEDEEKGNVSISLEKYTIFNVENPDGEGIFSTWQEIWKFEEEGKLNRAYTYDFEKYDPSGKVEIYIKEK